MCSRRDSTFRHYDSSGSFNEHAARQIAMKMQPHVGLEKSHVMFAQEKCTQQENCECVDRAQSNTSPSEYGH